MTSIQFLISRYVVAFRHLPPSTQRPTPVRRLPWTSPACVFFFSLSPARALCVRPSPATDPPSPDRLSNKCCAGLVDLCRVSSARSFSSFFQLQLNTPCFVMAQRIGSECPAHLVPVLPPSESAALRRPPPTRCITCSRAAADDAMIGSQPITITRSLSLHSL